MPGLKIGNQYAGQLGELYRDTPKAVFAAIAISFAAMTVDSAEELINDRSALREKLLEEWQALHTARIVPQRPPSL